MDVLVTWARVALAAVFVVSAVAKLRDRPGSREAVVAFGVPGALVGTIAAGLPISELACAVLLVLPDPWAVVGAVASLVLLLAFTGAVIYQLARGNHPECHCFGSIGNDGGIGWGTVGRNGVLVLLAAVTVTGPARASLWSEISNFTGTEVALFVLGLLAAAAVTALSLAVLTLMRRYGDVLLRLEALEHATGLAQPVPATDFTLPDLDGQRLNLTELVEEGRPVLLAFVSPTCHNCTDLLPDLAEWQGDPEHPLAVVVLSDGSVDANREKLTDVGPLRVLRQPDHDIADAYGVQGTPAAVVIGADGRVAGPVAHAVDGVRNLHATMLQAMSGGPADATPDAHVHAIEPRPVLPGDEIPQMPVLTEQGDEALLEDALGPEAVVLFWRTDCGFCQQILADVKSLQSSVPMRIVTESDLGTLRASGLSSPVVRDPEGRFQNWLNVPGTPSAARIRDGKVDASLAVGGPAVLDLVRSSADLALESFGPGR